MAKKTNRDDFPSRVVKLLADRTGHRCSFPGCPNPTVGAALKGPEVVRTGVAAHIHAAAPGGRRYKRIMTPAERSSQDNGIWLCQLHARIVDAPDSTYEAEVLQSWKTAAELNAARRVIGLPLGPGHQIPQSGEALASAIAADLANFRRSVLAPVQPIELVLRIDGIDEPVTASGVAALHLAARDVVLSAPPGAGKSVTMAQIAESLQARGALPLYVPLGEWAPLNVSLLQAISQRRGFMGIGTAGLEASLGQPGVVLVLDGWNELDEDSRGRVRSEITRLRRDYPDLRFVISTRHHAPPPPVDGLIARIQDLDRNQQVAIAGTRLGEAGVRLINIARRTPGLRELIATPLYLSALLEIAPDGPLPATKEEVLRGFVAAHDRDEARLEALRRVTSGFEVNFIGRLATAAIETSATALTEEDARRVVADEQNRLHDAGQIAIRQQPNDILAALSDHHLLVHTAAGQPYQFQHQQVLEWLASGNVEQLMQQAATDETAQRTLRETVLNVVAWEQSILFACERLSRGDAEGQDAAAEAILLALQVDPMLAARMIQRSGNSVWARISPDIQRFVQRWHTAGRGDRAALFVVRTGRPEFAEIVWPLLGDGQGRIFRAEDGFQVSVLGADAVTRTLALPAERKRSLMWQFSMEGGIAGIDLVEEIATAEPHAGLKAQGVAALDFVGASQQLQNVLRTASDETFDYLARGPAVRHLDDSNLRQRFDGAVKRAMALGSSPGDRLIAAISGDGDPDSVAQIISEIEIPDGHNQVAGLIQRAHERFPRAVALGLLQRCRAGQGAPYWTPRLIAAADLDLEDDELVACVRSPDRRDRRAEAAVVALGPNSVIKLIDDLLAALKQQYNPDGSINRPAQVYYHHLLRRLQHARPGVLVKAVQARAKQDDLRAMTALADLLMADRSVINHQSAPYSQTEQDEIAGLLDVWAEQLLSAAEPDRSTLSELVGLAKLAPSVRRLPLLQRMLDADLSGWRREKESLQTSHARLGQARMSFCNLYQGAFAAIRDPAVAAMLEPYLTDEEFGVSAAVVIRNEWLNENLPARRGLIDRLADYSGVGSRRAKQASDPIATSPPAEQIFAAIDQLMANGEFAASPQMQRLAVRLAVVAAPLPHGKRAETIRSLLGFGERRDRGDLLAALAWSGEMIDSGLILPEIDEILAEAKTKAWMLDQNQDQLRIWLELLAFSDNPGFIPRVIATLPDHARLPWRLEGVVSALGNTPDDVAIDVLFQLAIADRRLMENFGWQQAIGRKEPLAVGRRLADLIVGASAAGKLSGDARPALEMLAGTMAVNADLRREVYERFSTVEPDASRAALAYVIMQAPDAEGLVLVVQDLVRTGKPFPSGQWQAIEKIVTRHELVEDSSSTYVVHPVAVGDLRKSLLGMVTNGGKQDAAATCLTIIDDIRDEYGAAYGEPRHPDLASGRPWPMPQNEDAAPAEQPHAVTF
jgi:hypothetical protein